jgi:hypothetical protein
MSSLAAALRQELARLLEPLVVAAGSAERWSLVLSLVGHTADAAANPGLRAALDDLGALANLDDVNVETLEGIQAILGAAAAATRALHEIERTANDPALGERLKQFGPEFAEQLTTIYLRRFHPRLFRLATIFDIIDPLELRAPQPAQFEGNALVRTAWLGDELHLDRVGPLLRDPGAALRAAYLPNDLRTAADAHAAADRLFPLLRAALDELGLASSLERRSLTPDEPGDASGDGDHFNSPEPNPDDATPAPPVPDLAPYYRSTQPRLAIRFPQLQADGVLAGTFLGIDVAASSLEHPGAVAGLIVELTGALNWTQTRGPWTITLETDGQVPAFSIGPQGMELAPLSSALTAAKGRLSATRGAGGTPSFSVGDPSGTRLELGAPAFSARLDLGPDGNDVGFSAGTGASAFILNADNADGFLRSVLPADGMRVDFDLGLDWSRRGGLTFKGAMGLDLRIPVGISLGPVLLSDCHLRLAARDGEVYGETSLTLSATLGPARAVIDRIGIAAQLTFPEEGGSLGVADLDFRFKWPSGIGLVVEAAGVATGGGFLFYDEAQGLYAGVLELSLSELFTLKAIGLITTKMPDGSPGFTLVIFITAEDFQPIQLSMGFTLNGIGGMLAINRTFDENALREGMQTGLLASILFPRDPVANAPAIINALSVAFPARRGAYLFGVLVKIGWFTPTVVAFDLALILELGARRRLLVLGRVSALLPSADNDLVRLNLESMGVIDFDEGTVALDAVLVDSRLVQKFVLTGGMALRARWSAGPGSSFVLAVGGLNPRFAPPAGLPKLVRIAIALSSGDNPRITCAAYFAITANTLQFGARAELYAAAYGFSIQGDIGFDVLIQYRPLHFVADFHASVQLKRGSSSLFKVTVDGSLEGPRPLRVSGKAAFEICCCDFSIPFDKTLVEGEPPPPPPAVDVLTALREALADQQSWEARSETSHGIVLRSLSKGDSLIVDPVGRLVIRQQVVPLNTDRDVDLLGGAPVSGTRRFSLSATLNGAELQAAAVREQFAPSQYFDLTDDEKLTGPSFEEMDAGIAAGDIAIAFAAGEIVAAPLEYESIVIDAPDQAPPADTRFRLDAGALQLLAETGAAARAPVRRVGKARFRDAAAAPAVTIHAPEWRIVSVDDRALLAASVEAKSWSEQSARLATLNREGVRWQLVPAHELVA